MRHKFNKKYQYQFKITASSIDENKNTSVIFLLKSVHLLVEYIKYRYLIPASLTLVKHITYKDVSIC